MSLDGFFRIGGIIRSLVCHWMFLQSAQRKGMCYGMDR